VEASVNLVISSSIASTYQYLIKAKRNTTAGRMSVLLGFAQADSQPTLRDMA
jgi:hypothetical protein